ncbi:hypothetical protein, partial [Lentilactobacillus farraginis]|uniref:hypothetical protein n=1 Tax=Lentilactobacillus farraginis TaxID=390841 RepID=UPI001F490106
RHFLIGIFQHFTIVADNYISSSVCNNEPFIHQKTLINPPSATAGVFLTNKIKSKNSHPESIY